MKRSRAAIALAVVAAALAPDVARPQVFTQAEKEAILAAHNDVRCGVTPTATTMPPLVWDAALEAMAQTWAQGCQNIDAYPNLIDHNPSRSDPRFYVGENIAASSPGPMSAVSAVQLWADEVVDYNHAANACTLNEVCGHYTQVVWANTRRVGCARWHCAGIALPSSIVCDYGPGGNTGQRPYTAGAGINGACDLIFQDGFEFNTVAPWTSAQVDGGDLGISTAAAMSGTRYGLQAVVDDTASLYVADESPADDNRYRARFYFDPNGFDPGELALHFRTRIFIGFEEGPTRRLFAVELRREAGVFALMGRARLDDNSQADTGFFTITDAPHRVEIDWRRASGPTANDGRFEMWIDGTSVSVLSGLDNSASAVDFARLGALSVKTGASGTLFWDEFESRETSLIGP